MEMDMDQVFPTFYYLISFATSYIAVQAVYTGVKYVRTRPQSFVIYYSKASFEPGIHWRHLKEKRKKKKTPVRLRLRNSFHEVFTLLLLLLYIMMY